MAATTTPSATPITFNLAPVEAPDKAKFSNIEGIVLELSEQQRALTLAQRPPPSVVINWQLKPELCFWLPRNLYRRSLTQMAFGERWVSSMCATWAKQTSCPGMAAFLERQGKDETEHAALLERYLARIGLPAEVDSGMFNALDSAENSEDILAQFLVIYLVLENEAIHILKDATQCPLFQQICQRILLDEAKHISFGKLVLRPRLSLLSVERRIALYCWLEWLWRSSATSQIEALLGPLARPCRRAVELYLDHRWRWIARGLLAIGLTAPAGSQRREIA